MLPGMFPNYSRNVMLESALKLAGIQVSRCLASDIGIVAQYRQLWNQLKSIDFHVLLLTYPAHRFIPLAWAVARRRKVPMVLDPLFSLFDTKIGDRREASPLGFHAMVMMAIDWAGCRISARILTDSWAYAEFLSDRTGVPRERFVRVWTGTDERLLRLNHSPPVSSCLHPGPGTFHAVHYGNYFPLQGSDVIVRAAETLSRAGSPAIITMIGDGPARVTAQELAHARGLRNVRFVGRVEYPKLHDYLHSADVVLGVFGTSGKASRVIPNKVFDALAMGRPLITGDTPAAREFLEDAVHALLSPVGDADGLAERIDRVRTDENLRHHLSEQGRRKFAEDASAVAQSTGLATLFQDLVTQSDQATDESR
jgi:glycosyltransferase involved in cell wall biosynthesis